MIERLGYSVTVKLSSIEALEIFRTQPQLFDLVITDQTMPGMTGADMTRSMGIREFALKPLVKNDIAKLIQKVLASDEK